MWETFQTMAIPIASLLIGWLLGEASSRRRAREERRVVVGRGLFFLLREHHDNVGAITALQGLKAFAKPDEPSPVDVLNILEKSIIPGLLPADRLEGLVEEMAGFAPALAHEIGIKTRKFRSVLDLFVKSVPTVWIESPEIGEATYREMLAKIEVILREREKWLRQQCLWSALAFRLSTVPAVWWELRLRTPQNSWGETARELALFGGKIEPPQAG